MEATISAHGLKLFVREQGEGHPLVLINGIGASSEMWGNAERILAASSRTIVFDSPGTGRSETPLFPRSISALARVTCALLDELGHERVDLLGFSFGGTIAQQLAKDRTRSRPASRTRLDVLRLGRNRQRPGCARSRDR